MQHPFTLSLDGMWELCSCTVGSGDPGIFAAGPILHCPVPGDVHTAFIDAGIIPEPLHDRNDECCRFLEDQEFWYRRVFTLDENELRRRMLLTFGGLDCSADVYLNGVHLGRSENALVEVEYDVSACVHAGDNLLVVRIDQGLHAVQDKPLLDMGKMWNGDQPYRAWMRKPQYVYGWDWTIWLPTCGIWRSVSLCGYDGAYLTDVHLYHEGALAEGESARVALHACTEIPDGGTYTLAWRLTDQDGAVACEGRMPLAGGDAAVQLEIPQARLWWCNGMGQAHLYHADVSLLDADGRCLHTLQRKLGLRTVALQQQPLPGNESTFTFVLNGVPVFAKGANVVPEDCLIGRVTDAHTIRSVQLAHEAHMNMLRVWGGGVYASEAFLGACDELGVMVWHDFMFACGYHPDHDEAYMAGVEREVTLAIRRLRNHASVIGWSGNNEIQEMYLSQRRWMPEFPFYGQRIYTELLPRKVQEMHPGVIYRESSPLGLDSDPAGCTMGDQHIWHFTHRPNDPFYRDLWRFTDFPVKFLSEFGLIGAMNIETARKCLSPGHLDPDDPMWLFHTNSSADHQLLNMFVEQYFGPRKGLTLQQYILRSQAVQAEITRHIYDEFRARKFVCSGLLFWTLGDSLGINNWSLLNHDQRKKPVYHYLKRSMAPFAAVIRGYDVQSLRGMQEYAAYWAAAPAPLSILGVNDLRTEQPVHLSWRLMTRGGETVVFGEKDCKLPANASAELETVDVTGLITRPEDMLLHAVLTAPDGTVSENRYFFAPFARMLTPGGPECTVTRVDDVTFRLVLTAPSFVWMVHLETPDGVTPSDNDFDLMPGQTRVITVTAQSGQYEPCIHWLGEG